MRKWIPVLLLTALCAGVPPAQAATDTAAAITSAADLNALCTGAGSDVCSAYITGYAQGFYYATAGAKAGFPGCVPRGVGAAQARLIVTKFMTQHPEMAQQGAASVVAEALLVAFPCAGSR